MMHGGGFGGGMGGGWGGGGMGGGGMGRMGRRLGMDDEGVSRYLLAAKLVPIRLVHGLGARCAAAGCVVRRRSRKLTPPSAAISLARQFL